MVQPPEWQRRQYRKEVVMRERRSQMKTKNTAENVERMGRLRERIASGKKKVTA